MRLYFNCLTELLVRPGAVFTVTEWLSYCRKLTRWDEGVVILAMFTSKVECYQKYEERKKARKPCMYTM